ncbi:MAG TPA: lipopolysaccharide assembly protein LapA domain-containing protein [Actinomycetota bacterium]|nr:lipopolysaccharide assembly protein LapA domain-containing protein [Actinomycetota bacterium]
MRREGDPGEGDGMGRPPVQRSGPSGKWIAIIVAAVLLLIFAIQNSERVDVDFFVIDTRARVVTVIVVAAALGFVIGFFVGRPSRSERKAMKD